MRKTAISADGCFEWDEDKGKINKKLHGLYFNEILSAFDDPYILELYDEAHSDFAETRFKGLAELQDFIIPYLSYTKLVRQAGPR
ncbi:MAG: BrnT family toxin [Treponema sp.]|jgi:uncharacterized DUF497 family protein|nr:BrnT family toxin [Treponema sp.]